MRSTFLLLVLFCLVPLEALAGSRLLPGGSNGWHLLGDSLAISGTTAAVSAPGTAQVYIREFQPATGWVTTKVIGENGPLVDQYVCLSGDHLAVREYSRLRLFNRHAGGTNHWGLVQEFAFTAAGIALDGNRFLTQVSGATRVYEWDAALGTWQLATTFGTLPPAALSGDTAALVYQDPYSSGLIRMYQRQPNGTWLLTADVIAPVGIYRDHFGAAVALEGDWLIVGAPGTYSTTVNRPGKTHVFHRNQGGVGTWGHVQTLVGVGECDGFGASVEISGNQVAIGMTGLSQTIHVFTRPLTTYSLKGRFRPSVPYSQSFGRAVGLSGNLLLASDLWANVPNNYAGAVYSFDTDSGTPASIKPHAAIYTSLAEAARDNFGDAVAIDAGTLAIGSPAADDPMSDGGAVFLYVRQSGGSWTSVKKLVPSDVEIQAFFGRSLALSGDTLAAASTSGIYLFGRNSGGTGAWGQTRKLLTSYPNAISMSGNTVAATDWNSKVTIFDRDYGGSGAWGGVILEYSCSAVSVDGNTLALSGASSQASVFTRSGAGDPNWQYAASISTPYPFYMMGAVSVAGDTIAIAGLDSAYGQARPLEIVSIRRRNQGGPNQWGEVARVSPPDRSLRIGFGHVVRLKGNRLVIGAPEDVTAGVKSGSIYVFDGSADFATWKLIRKTRAATPAADARFGAAADTNGNDVVGGAPGFSAQWPGAGAADVSSTNTRFAEWIAEHSPGAPPNSQSYDPDLDGLGLLQEYAMGFRPGAADFAPLRVNIGADGTRTVDFSLAKDAPDAEARLEWSLDLRQWRAAGDGLTLSTALISETEDSWVYRATVPASAETGLFFRMRSAPRL